MTSDGGGAATTPLVPYGQGRVRGLGATQVGTHGAEMDHLVTLGLPTVPGLTVPVEFAEQLTHVEVARHAVDLVEELCGRRVGDKEHPLLLRLVASAPVPASGLPPDAPGLGVSHGNADTIIDLIGRAEELHATWSSVLRMLAEDALDVDPDDLDDAVAGISDPRAQIEAMITACAERGSGPFPEEPAAQLALAARAALQRWRSPRGLRARRAQSLPDDLGLALHVQALRVGPWERSGHGSATSRDPDTGAPIPHGAFYRGVRRSSATPSGMGEPLTRLPGGADLLREALTTLEHHFGAVAQVGFEVRDGKLSLLSASPDPHPTTRAAARLAVDLATTGRLDKAHAVMSVRPETLQEMLHARLRLTGDELVLVTGLAASPGAARGLIALSSQRALELAASGVPTVLIATETTPGDVPALLAAEAVVTTAGGLASHAAVVARGAGRPAVCGAVDLKVDLDQCRVSANDLSLLEGEIVTVDGRTGTVYAGQVEITAAEPPPELDQLLAWADGFRRMGVRANADTVREAAEGFRLGAEGIGLCRTEHQFLGERLPLVRAFLLAESEQAHAAALVALTQAQRDDFRDLLREVGDRPVTVRLLDAPLHEFLPLDEIYDDPRHAQRARELREVNPMLGLRGVRLALLNQGLYPAQAEALFSAWLDVVEEGSRPQLEVMIPLVSIPQELDLAVEHVRRGADRVRERTGVDVPYLVGSMVETPRAALLAGELAKTAQFLSFGTNDLTQMTYGFSRDDVERRLLQSYVEQGLLPASPFVEFDPHGVGALVAIAAEQARAARPDIKLGLCGEHGGDAASIAAIDRLGLDYVSCSPQRVPIARLAAAQASLEAAP